MTDTDTYPFGKDGEPPTIHVALARVLDELPAIGKNQRNQQQGFQFRGIDDVLDALNPLLAKHGVFFVPDVIARETSERSTKSGGTLWVVSLHVRYRFYGPRGDFVEASGWGEGTDSGDKATPKAMTGALKYVLFQTFAIATNEQSDADADRSTPEETTHPPRQAATTPDDQIPRSRYQRAVQRCQKLVATKGIDLDAEREKRVLPALDPDMPLDEFELYCKMLDTLEAE